ncbi:hypothetical protein PTSG_02167 [Salpingoeca rosetta]|uniref:Uncharacterized protein n=1 Tax=Salpingoeca rosetta (strain ATCC 50818 / BSB-021) TaxID=946362 RepID=F2U1E4_SALR5|nr:uncharacterized protein PTSG_02167 [Salpingoeca rosetta]EGD81446.1 hypothetical protein PTSG_02167 [Salpingoeca rosetta]|eukprot:XP_004996650.1 hypothetical protein PTSG_02167 [Salpingoeca rosetta]
MATVGRSTQETTSQGQDGQHRMRVDAKYNQLSEYKPKLRKVMLVLNAFYLITAIVSAYVYKQNGSTYLHPAIFAGLGLQVLASRALKRNSAGILVLFSTLTSVAGAYLVYAGVGRTMTVIEIAGASPFTIFLLVVNALGALGHLVAVYYARRLVDAMRITARQRPTKSKKAQ